MAVRRTRAASWIASLTVATVLIAGCSSSQPGSIASSAAGTASSTTASGSSSGAAAAAIATTKQYTDGPSAFPVTAALPKALPPGTTFGWMQCVSSVCAQLTVLFTAAAKAIGGRLIVVKTGASAQEEQTALSSLIEQKPAAILLPSIQPQGVTAQLQQAKAAGIPTISTGIMDSAASGITAGTFGNGLATLAGKLLADWVVSKSATSDVVFYTTHELSFLNLVEPSFRAELGSVCSGCTERTVNVPIATYGNSAPQLVVSDLEAHPSTTLAVFGAAAATAGLVAALKVASLKTPFIGFSLTPANLQDIQNGAQAAGLALDYPVLAWTMVDQAARLILKTPLTPLENQQLAPVQWLTAGNLHGDVSKSWTGYPDFAARFSKLWNV